MAADKKEGYRIAVQETAIVEKFEGEKKKNRRESIEVYGVGEWTWSDGTPITEPDVLERLDSEALMNAVNGVVRFLLNDDVKVQLAPILQSILATDVVTPEHYLQLEHYGFPATEITAEMLNISTTDVYGHMNATGIPRKLFIVLMQTWAANRGATQRGE